MVVLARGRRDAVKTREGRKLTVDADDLTHGYSS